MGNEDQGCPVIFSYSRAQAIEDGVLIDVSDAATARGFRIPVACTDHLYHGYLVPPFGLSGEGQSFEGRLHDLLMLTLIAASTHGSGDRVSFRMDFLMRPGESEAVTLLAVVGPGDRGEPVMTIMLPEDE